MSKELEKRLIDLEVRYTHQQDTLEALSDVVVEQGKAIAKLQERLREMTALRDELRDALREAEPEDQVPPHY